MKLAKSGGQNVYKIYNLAPKRKKKIQKLNNSYYSNFLIRSKIVGLVIHLVQKKQEMSYRYLSV